MSDLDHIEKVSAKERFAVFLVAPNASFDRLVAVFIVSVQVIKITG